jgi:glycine cleavage system H protein
MAKPSPNDRKYSKEHEWAKPNGDGTVTMGITDYAQELLTDVVYVELPAVGRNVNQLQPIAVVESVKSVSDIFAPVGGEVTEVNKALETTPELINQDAYGEGWIAKIRMVALSELDALMTAEAYEEYIKTNPH